VTSNAYSFAARADVPLCVTLSAVTSVVTVFTIPFLIQLALQTFVEQEQAFQIPLLNTLLNLMSFTLPPGRRHVRARPVHRVRRAGQPFDLGVT
jgi:BASS family bile acid:Na+ symporter